ncbi:Endoglucanase cel12C [Ceratobasidium theobromae]|uniref:Endoglucanase cel12C n=1 Tax=Ceratobasidium theobromae TaxID=1582974 RepID=A0A5N5QA81_9AGAM|nr:Endoglucanase cel12C [Ceratobasidium theobromae]
MSFKLFAIASLAFEALVSASPMEASVARRNSGGSPSKFKVLTGQWDTESLNGGYYTLYNNLWGMPAATSGWEFTQATSVNGTNVAWATTYSWVDGPYNVKGYANLGLSSGLGKQLSGINSIVTEWNWTYSAASTDLVANVAYDLWLSPSTSPENNSDEVMFWLSTRGGAHPVGSQNATFSAGGITWKLFKGTVSNWTVWSFVAPSEITSFNADFKPFITYLIDSHGLSSSKYLTGVQAGTESFIGSATFTTTKYSVTVN